MIALDDAALKGSFTPLVTPFHDDGSVDFDTFATLVDHQATNGSHGIVVSGTTGEPSTLTIAERLALTKVAVATAAGRIQVVAATGCQSHAETVELTEKAAELDIAALLIVTPYFIRPPQRGLETYYGDLCRRTDRPIMIYHIPGRSAVEMAPETLARIAESAPNLVGAKHASTDLGWVTQVLSLLGADFRIHVGLEDLSFPMLALGAHGLMNAVGNLAPDRVAALYERTAAGDLPGARALHFELQDLNRSIFFDTNPIPIKYMMLSLGMLPNEIHRLPMVSSTPELRGRLDRVIAAARIGSPVGPSNDSAVGSGLTASALV